MRIFLEILGGLALIGGGVLLLVWCQSRLDRRTGWRPDRDTDLGPPEPPGGIDMSTPEGYLESLGRPPDGFDALRWLASHPPPGCEQEAAELRQKHGFGPVCAKTTSQDAPGSPNATLPATSAPPILADIPPRKKP